MGTWRLAGCSERVEEDLRRGSVVQEQVRPWW